MQGGDCMYANVVLTIIAVMSFVSMCELVAIYGTLTEKSENE
jgi:hypothetical protein